MKFWIVALTLVGTLTTHSAHAADDLRLLTIDGKEVIVFAERNDEDGGIVTNTLVPKGDGTYYNYRTWQGRGVKKTDATADEATVATEKETAQEEALSAFEKLTDAEIQERAELAATAATVGQ